MVLFSDVYKDLRAMDWAAEAPLGGSADQLKPSDR